MATYSVGPESVQSPALVVNQFTLTMSQDGNGTVVPAVGTHNYIEGKKVMLVAAPDADNKFIEWTGDVVEDNDASPTQITMDGNKSVEAVFAATFLLTLVSTGGGTTIPAPGVIEYIGGKVVNLKAYPNEGFEFDGWSGDVTNTGDVYALTMNADKTVAATFKQKAVAATTKKKIYWSTVKKKAFWNVDGLWEFFATPVHSLLEGIGSNTHDQIDEHIAATDNPHGVTAAQTGAMATGTGLLKLSGSVLPAADASYRYQFFTVEGSVGPPAVADGLYYCRSTDGGTAFEWKAVSLV